MKIKIGLIVSIIYLLMPLAFAANNHIEYVREFVGGLDVSQILSCEKHYANSCPNVKTESVLDSISQQRSCLESKMAKDKSCIQATTIRKLTYYPASQIKKYGKITVFYVTTLADDIDEYYMVDTKGNLISLDDTTDPEFAADKNYQILEKSYPHMELTQFLYWTKMNENLFPKYHLLPNGNQQLLFKQDLRDGPCVACKTVGIANIAYEFDRHGAYLQSKLLNVTLPG